MSVKQPGLYFQEEQKYNHSTTIRPAAESAKSNGRWGRISRGKEDESVKTSYHSA
jgi:hypothetical protein